VKLVLSLLLTLAIGGIAGWITNPEIGGWYQTIQKPSWQPPNWVFGPVWTVLYILMGIAFWLVWREPSSERRNAAIVFFMIQLLFNFLWSIIFFNFHSIGWALIDIAALWIFIIITIFSFRRVNKTAAWLMVPYICWVSFAMILNYSIFRLNG
jgi:benzodiazapine receptor